MTTPTVRIPATDQVDHRARAYNGTQALADLAQHLDPRLTARLTVGAEGRELDVLLYRDSTIRDAEWLAHRLGLPRHTEHPVGSTRVMHRWSGTFGGFAAMVDWIDNGADQ